MHGRKMTDLDFVRLAKLARLQGVELPGLANNVICKRLVTGGPDIVVCAALARVEVMAHLYMDHSWETPAFRLEALKILHAEMRRELKEKGIEIAHAELAPGIERSFGRRLAGLGWEPCGWKQLVIRI